MSDRRSDPLDELLGGLRVPPPALGLVDRIVAEATRPDRVATPPAAPARRRPVRRWSRRGVWTTVLAINLVLVSAVAAAFGTGAITGSRIAAVAQHVVAHFRAAPAAARVHHGEDHRPRAVFRQPRLAAAPLLAARPRPEPVRPFVPTPSVRPVHPDLARPVPLRRFARPVRLHPPHAAPAPRRPHRLAWQNGRGSRGAIMPSERAQPGYLREERRQQFGPREGAMPERQGEDGRFEEHRFGRRMGLGPQRFRRDRAGFAPWGGRRGPPRRRF